TDLLRHALTVSFDVLFRDRIGDLNGVLVGNFPGHRRAIRLGAFLRFPDRHAHGVLVGNFAGHGRAIRLGALLRLPDRHTHGVLVRNLPGYGRAIRLGALLRLPDRHTFGVRIRHLAADQAAEGLGALLGLPDRHTHGVAVRNFLGHDRAIGLRALLRGHDPDHFRIGILLFDLPGHHLADGMRHRPRTVLRAITSHGFFDPATIRSRRRADPFAAIAAAASRPRPP